MMSSKSLRARDYMEHMLEAVNRIGRYLAGQEERNFKTETLLQDGVLRNLEVLGEASKNFLAALPNGESYFAAIPFGILYATRNQLAHGYFRVDLDIVWRVTQDELPQLQRNLEDALAHWPSDLA